MEGLKMMHCGATQKWEVSLFLEVVGGEGVKKVFGF